MSNLSNFIVLLVHLLRRIESNTLTLRVPVNHLRHLKTPRALLFPAMLLLVLGLCRLPAFAQTPSPVRSLPAGSLPLPSDTVRTPADTVAAKAATKGDIETTIKYTARDSMEMDMVNRIVKLYGEAKVNYGSISLEAAQIFLDMDTHEVDAKGMADSTGKTIGVPKFKNGNEEYQAQNIRYNFKSQKGYIEEIVTQQGEGYIHGEKVGKDAENNLYIRDAIYTTCNLTHPHFHISAPKIKVVKDKQLVTGPFNLHINDVPTPLGFAFGIFPNQQRKPNGSSGLIFPTYGEERDRGFFLRQGGYYWAVSPYIGMAFTGEIYSRGGWGLQWMSNYKKRYSFNGRFDLRYNRRRIGDEGFQNINEDFWITWSHSPENRGGTGRFSASVNAGTVKFSQRNAFDINQRINPSFNSNVSYSNVVRGLPINYGVFLRQDMNTQTGIMNFTLPDLNLSVNRIYPFKGQVTRGKWYETIGLSYNFNGGIRLSNAPQTSGGIPGLGTGVRVRGLEERRDSVIGFNIANMPEIWRRAQIGATHQIPISMSMKLFRYFSLNPNFNYQETWYPQRYDYRFSPGDTSVVIDTLRGFSRTYQFNAGAGLTTNVYGTFYFKNAKRVEAIRHRLTPNVGFSYRPDFSRDRYGFYQYLPISGGFLMDPNSAEVVRVPRFSSGGFGSLPGVGQTGSINFSINNTLEAKIKPKSDSAGAKPEKVNILDNFTISSSYNIAQDSLNLSNINIAARTRILKTDVNFNMIVDPYITIADSLNARGRRINKFALLEGRGLGQVTAANMFFSKQFSSGNRTRNGKTTPTTPGPVNPVTQAATLEEMEYINANRGAYVDWNVPWNFGFSYSLTIAKQGLLPANINQVLTFNGDISLTDKWKISVNSGYDFVSKGVTNNTSIGIHRDLHCWEANINWIPFGIYQSYSFDLRVRASILQDLKLSKRNTWYDRGVGF